jgi:hypothetical protein
MRHLARRHGCEIPARARTKCGFCFTVRQFLRPFYPAILGPAEAYG